MYQYNAPIDPIKIKTLTKDGKDFDAIAEELLQPFPPEVHKYFKVGYDKAIGHEAYHVYVPWQVIEKFLIDLVGVSGFGLQVTGYFVDESGNPVLHGRLNILGVVKEDLGYGKSKDGWQGTKIEIARADLFKNCCERFGICKYLDDQLFTLSHLLSSPDAITTAMARQLMPYFQKKEEQRRKDLGLNASGNMIAAEYARRENLKATGGDTRYSEGDRQRARKPFDNAQGKPSVKKPSVNLPSFDPAQLPTDTLPAEQPITQPAQAPIEQAQVSSSNENNGNGKSKTNDYSYLLPWLRQQLHKCGYKILQERIQAYCDRISNSQGSLVSSFDDLSPRQQRTLLVQICKAFLQEKGIDSNQDLSGACDAIASATSYDDAVSKLMSFAHLVQAFDYQQPVDQQLTKMDFDHPQAAVKEPHKSISATLTQ